MLYYLLEHLTHMALLMVLALGLNLINGYTGMFSLGHHGFFAVGAYAAGALTLAVTPAAPSLGVGLGVFALSALGGVLAAAAFGVVVGVPCLRLRGDYLAIATLGFGEIVRIIIQNTEALGGARGLEVPYLLLTRGVDTQLPYVALYAALALLAVAATVWTLRAVLRSNHGRAMIAIREDEIAAELLGVNLMKYKLAAFILGAGFAGLAGALYTHFTTQIEPREFGLLKGIYILLYVVLGGMGSMSGTLLATALLYILDKMLLNLLPPEIQAWREVAFALMLVLVMILRPQGILGQKELYQTRLWRRLFKRASPAEAPAP